MNFIINEISRYIIIFLQYYLTFNPFKQAMHHLAKKQVKPVKLARYK